MNFFQSGFLVAATVLIVFADITNAVAVLSSDLSEMTENEKFVTSKGHQDLLETSIMTSTDQSSKSAKATIQAIREDALKYQYNGVSKDTVTSALESVYSMVRIISEGVHETEYIFNAAKNLTAIDPKAALEIVKKSIKSFTDRVYASGVPIQDTHGSSIALSNGLNREEIKESINTLQGVEALFECLEMAEQLAALSLKTGGSAAEDGLIAAREMIATGALAAYEYTYKGALHILKSLRNSRSQVLDQVNSISGIIETLKSPVSIDNEAGLAAIANLNNNLTSMSGMFSKKSAQDAAAIMNQGLISTILETANALAVAKKALKEAGVLASQNTDAAIDAVQKGIKAAIDEVVKGSTLGFLGFGAARQISGEKTIDGLIPSMIEIELGRVTVYEELELAEKVATLALIAGGKAAQQGIKTAMQICDAAGKAFFAQYLDGGKIGLNYFLTI